ncbi:MAG: ATP-binding protein [Syntrophobacteraceae bacterium]|nr:ATP-binding protein [Syntrophobacteraceae bacterium]
MNLRFSIAKKFVFAFLLLALAPMVVLGFWTLRSMRQVGQGAIESSTALLESRAGQALELRAVDLANRVSQLLQSCEADLLTLKMLPQNPEVYRRFSFNHQRDIWVRDLASGNPTGIHKIIPLYKEIAFIDAGGMERVLIADGQIVDSSKLRNVGKPENTTYKSERYFGEASKLASGEIWISHLRGWYVSREQALRGRRYEGVIRFATPCRDSRGRLEGVLVLSLDSRHLMELTSHVLPSAKKSGFPTYSSGNYVFLFDDEGWIISHPKPSDIRGVLPDGKSFSTSPESYTRDKLLAGLEPFNLDHVKFINPNYQLIAKEVRALRSGVTSTFNVAGTPRIMAYAPILCDRPPYNRHGIFGGITVGLETEKFKEPALLASLKIDEMVAKTKRNSIFVLAGSTLLAIGLALVLSRTFTRPILYLAAKAREIASGRIVGEVAVRTGDELEVLAVNFAHMASQILDHRKSLEESLRELAQSKMAVERHTEQLEKQLRVLNNIHYLSQYLSTVYDHDQVLRTVLKSCVEGLGFDRAILYLFDNRSNRLVCHNTYGFLAEEEKLAVEASYDIDLHDCIPTRAFRDSKTIFVRDIRSEKQATPLDLQIFSKGGSDFFVFTPIKSQGSVKGVLGADTKLCRREIKQIDVESLEILANDAARAMEHSELYSRLVSERNFIESIVTHITNGIITLDAGGKISWFNPYSERVFGCRREEVLALHYSEAFALLPSWVDTIDKNFASPDGNPIEVRTVFPDGKEKVLDVHFSTIREDAFLLIIQDITQRKLMEEHLRRSDRLISLGVVAAGIAHEIRNPLTGISLLLDDLHDHLHEMPEERELIWRSLQQIDRLENLVNGLVDFAVPSSRMKFELRPLGGVLENTLFLTKKLCKDNNISLSVKTEESLPRLRLDSEKMQQALLNLLMNAIQAMDKGGALRIEVKTISPEELGESRSSVRITVEDTGRGIAAEDIPYVFDPFFTRGKSGCGLGLAIVYGIIREHGGRISLSSKPGSGTTVRVDLPVVESAGA